MQLTEIYIRIQESLGVMVAEDARMYFTAGKREIPADGQGLLTVTLRDHNKTVPLVMPMPEILALEEDYSLAKFNPMAESFMAKAPSEIQNRLITIASGRIAVSAAVIMERLLDFILDAQDHASCDPYLFEIIQAAPAIKKDATRAKTRKYVSNVIRSNGGIAGPNAMGRFKLDRAVEYEGTKYSRGCRYIPVIEKWIGMETVMGHKRPNQQAGQIMDVVIDAVLVKGAAKATAVTSSRVAPYFEVFLRSYYGMAAHLNKLATLLGISGDPMAYIPHVMPNMTEMEELYVKQLRIPFPGNSGPLEEQAETIAVESAPEYTQTAMTPEPVIEPQTEDDEEEETPVSNIMDPATAGNLSPYARIRMMREAEKEKEGTVAVAKPTSSVVVETAPQVAVKEHTGAVRVEKADYKVQLKDAFQRPLTYADGSPFLVKQAEVPKKPFIQKVNAANNTLVFNSDGTPALVEYQAQPQQAQQPYPGYPPQQAPMYSQPQYAPPPVNPNDPMAAYRASRGMPPPMAGYSQPAYAPPNPWLVTQPGGMPQQPAYPGYPPQQPPMYAQPQYPGYPPQQPPMYGQPAGYNPAYPVNPYAQPGSTVNVAPTASYH